MDLAKPEIHFLVINLTWHMLTKSELRKELHTLLDNMSNDTDPSLFGSLIVL